MKKPGKNYSSTRPVNKVSDKRKVNKVIWGNQQFSVFYFYENKS